ncbi:MAG: glycosyltransferase family 4 protein [Gemmatimonadetes bacterium]|nr:glycosyltransferase family 4 protein [Gemmatimonadota bacterium]
MRLAINGRFYAAEVTGVQRFAREIASRLCERTAVTLLLPRGVEPPEVTGSPRVLRGRLRGHAFEQLEVPAMTSAAGCDATLHLSGTLPVRGGPHIAVLHDVLPLTNPEFFSRRFARWYGFVLRTGAPRAAALITVSEWSKREIVRTLGVAASSVSVVLQGIAPFDRPADPITVREARQRLGLPAEFVLALGDGDARKNLAFLGEVMATWRQRHATAIPLVIVGSTTQRVHGRSVRGLRRARDRALSRARYVDQRPPLSRDPPDIVRPGRVSDRDLHALYTAASALCFPSLAEGFGRPPLEAAACGTPAIVAPIASARETLDNAALAVPLDPALWADALHELLSDPLARAALLEGAKPVLARMSWDACADRVLDICQSAIGQPRGQAASVNPDVLEMTNGEMPARGEDRREQSSAATGR